MRHPASKTIVKQLIRLLFVTACLLCGAASHAQDPEKLIAELAQIEMPGSGMSPVFSGMDFPPVRGQQQMGAMTLSQNMRHATPEAVVQLVALGPEALPALLRHLDDKQPTKLIIKHEGHFGGMWHAKEVFAPKESKDEQDALRTAGLTINDDKGFPPNIPEHRLTIGDACFSVIGMITNRRYNAVRYQPTACIVINSPVHSPQIAQAVRGMWKQPDLKKALLERLWQDVDLDDVGAATRLLYYDRDGSVGKVRALLDASAVKKAPKLGRLIAAIVWCEEPGLRARIQQLVTESSDAEVVESGATALANAPLEVTLPLMNRWKGRDGWNGVEAALALMTAALEGHPDESGRIIASYLAKAGQKNIARALTLFYGLKSPPVHELKALLLNQSKGYGQYLIDGAPTGPHDGQRLDYRVCDNAFEIISRALGDTRAVSTGTRKEMNTRISRLLTRLKGNPASWAFKPDEIAAFDASRDQARNQREEILSRIRSAADTKAEQWLLTLLEDRLDAADWKEAALHLHSPAGEEPELQAGILQANRHLRRKRVLDTLPESKQAEITPALARRLETAMSKQPASAYPLPFVVQFAMLVCFGEKGGSQPVLAKVIRQLDAALDKHGWPQEDDADSALDLLDVFLDERVPGAAAFYLRLAKLATPARLEDGLNEEDFFRIMARAPADANVRLASEWLFTRPKSPWRLSACSYPNASDLGNCGLLPLPAFRASLKDALGKDEVVGTMSIKTDKPDYCWMEWKSGGSSGQGLDLKQPIGVSPGESMPVRRCDAVLEGIANAVFAEHDGPEFHIWWPQTKRDESIRRWIEFLDKHP